MAKSIFVSSFSIGAACVVGMLGVSACSGTQGTTEGKAPETNLPAGGKTPGATLPTGGNTPTAPAAPAVARPGAANPTTPVTPVTPTTGETNPDDGTTTTPRPVTPPATPPAATPACRVMGVSLKDPVCDKCAKASCCPPLKACVTAKDCVDLNKCMGTCQTQTGNAATKCEEKCATDHPAGTKLIEDLSMCIQTSCMDACQAPTDGSSDSTGGGT